MVGNEPDVEPESHVFTGVKARSSQPENSAIEAKRT